MKKNAIIIISLFFLNFANAVEFSAIDSDELYKMGDTNFPELRLMLNGSFPHAENNLVPEGTFYHTLYNYEVTGDCWFSKIEYQGDGTYLKTVDIYLTNACSYLLKDVSWLLQFAYYPAAEEAFTYYNSEHMWYLHRGHPYNEKWVQTHGVMGQYDLLSMDRGITNAPLFREYWGACAYLSETDEVTIISLGDLYPGETSYRKVYIRDNFRGLGIRGYLLTTYRGQSPIIAFEIQGPNEVAGGFSTRYSAVLTYEDGTTEDVTDTVAWSVEPNEIASINSGLLQTEEVDGSDEITIYARYTEGAIILDAHKPVSVFEVCRRGSALEFDGVDDYVDLSYNAVTTTEFTVAGWANHYGPAGGADHDNKIFVQRDDDVGSNHSGVGLTSMTSSGVARASMRSSIGSTQVLETPRKPYGEWHHYAMTVDSDDFTFYVDGVEVDRALVNQSGNYWTSIDHVYIGRLMYEGELKGSFNGAIDDVRVYDRALSTEEVQVIMHNKPAVDEPNLVAYWDFDEGEGQIAYDMSGSDNDGQLGSTHAFDNSDPQWVDPEVPIGACNPPIANAGADQTVYAEANCTALVTLDGSDSNDPDGDELTYVWFMDGIEMANGVSPTIELSTGEYVIELIVTDIFNDSDSDEVVITVEDVTGPEFILTVEPAELKPHNHQMVLVTPVWDVNDNCDEAVEVSLLSITSSQADDGTGDGKTTDDILITEEGLIYLRAEIGDSSEDRIYTLTFEAADDSGNSTIESAIVVVPVEQLWRHREAYSGEE